MHAEQSPKTHLTLYKALQQSICQRLLKCREKWSLDIPSLDNDDWEDMLDYPLQQLVSTRDRLIQFKIIPHNFLTPERLATFSADHSDMCCKMQWFQCQLPSHLPDLSGNMHVLVPGYKSNFSCHLYSDTSEYLFTSGHLGPQKGYQNITWFPNYARKATGIQLSLYKWKLLINSNLPLYKDA